MENEQFQDLSNKLDVITRLLAFNLIEEKKQKEQILLLSRIGIQPKIIAELLNTTSNTVRVTLSKMRNNK